MSMSIHELMYVPTLYDCGCVRLFGKTLVFEIPRCRRSVFGQGVYRAFQQIYVSLSVHGLMYVHRLSM